MDNSLKTTILLRDILDSDLTIFFEQQLDPDAIYMAAFTAKEPTNRDAFMTHWAKIMADETIIIKSIIFQDYIAGYISMHSWFGEPEITYWIGKPYWGKGVTTKALTLFVDHIKTRPLYARVAKDNLASRRVLEKCNFIIFDKDKGFANARGQEIEEYIMKLSS